MSGGWMRAGYRTLSVAGTVRAVTRGPGAVVRRKIRREVLKATARETRKRVRP